MKDYYTIGEISRLYGIGADSLRYYEEAGAISPGRDDNGYRMYSMKDIYRLNVIRDFLRLGFSMKQIREYLDCQNLESTLAMLEKERGTLEEKRRELIQMERDLAERTGKIRFYRDLADGELRTVVYPNRWCLCMRMQITRDEEVDFAVRRLQKKYGAFLPEPGRSSFGSLLCPRDLEEGRDHLIRGVFILTDKKPPEPEPADLLCLPAGEYLTLCYRGSYDQSPRRARELTAEAARLGCGICGDILELYPIDNRYTGDCREFVTRLEVKTAGKDSSLPAE